MNSPRLRIRVVSRKSSPPVADTAEMDRSSNAIKTALQRDKHRKHLARRDLHPNDIPCFECVNRLFHNRDQGCHKGIGVACAECAPRGHGCRPFPAGAERRAALEEVLACRNAGDKAGFHAAIRALRPLVPNAKDYKPSAPKRKSGGRAAITTRSGVPAPASPDFSARDSPVASAPASPIVPAPALPAHPASAASPHSASDESAVMKQNRLLAEQNHLLTDQNRVLMEGHCLHRDEIALLREEVNEITLLREEINEIAHLRKELDEIALLREEVALLRSQHDQPQRTHYPTATAQNNLHTLNHRVPNSKPNNKPNKRRRTEEHGDIVHRSLYRGLRES